MRMSRKTKVILQVESVPADSGARLFPARLPAIASVAVIGTKRAKIITRPSAEFRKGVFALKPAKAEPLLPPAEEKA